MHIKLLTEHHLEFLSLEGGFRGFFESAHVKMPHCLKSHALTHICIPFDNSYYFIVICTILCKINLAFLYVSFHPHQILNFIFWHKDTSTAHLKRIFM